MIPLLHITTFVCACFCFFVVRKLYSSYKESKDENIGNFLKTFIFAGIYFIAVSLPGLVVSDPFWVQTLYIIGYIPLFLSPVFLLKIAFNLYHLPGKKYILPSILAIIIVTTVLSIIFFAPSEPASADGVFYYWLEKTPLWLRDFDGIMITFLIAGGAFLFLNGGRKVGDKTLRVRSFLLGTGLSILAVAISLNYIFALHTISKTLKMWSVFSAGFLALFGVVAILVGIYYKNQKQLK
ncbi:MAG: hypothetical protein WC514_01380 [Candidatus Paceibacterota bacterium]